MPRQRRKYALRRKVAKTAKKRLRKGLAAARYKQSDRRENRASAQKNAPERAFGRRAAKVGPFPGKRGRAETGKRGGGRKRGGFPVHSRKMARRKIRLGRRRRGRTQRKSEKHKTDGIRDGSTARPETRHMLAAEGKKIGKRKRDPALERRKAEKNGLKERKIGDRSPENRKKGEIAPKRCTFFCFCSIITK